MQFKLSKGLPRTDMPKSLNGVLLRGDAPEKVGGPTKRRGWVLILAICSVFLGVQSNALPDQKANGQIHIQITTGRLSRCLAGGYVAMVSS